MAVGQKWTDKGQEFAIDQLDDNFATATPAYWGAWGSGSATPAVTDTIITEYPEARVQILAAAQTQPATDTLRLVYQMIATATRATVQETGIFSASTAGNMYIRIVHGSLALESGDSVTYTVNLRLKDDSEA